MKKFLTLVLILSNYVLIAQTEISGVINSDQVWSAEDSPFHMVGDIALLSGYTLTIEPGVIIHVMGDYTMYVRGELIANGTTNNEITFKYGTSDSEESELWGGFLIQNTNDSHNYVWHYLNVINSFWGITIESFGGGLELNNCSIMYSHYGIYAASTGNNMQPVSLNNCMLKETVYGLFFMDALQMFNTVMDGGEKAIYGGNTAMAINIDECEIKNFTGDYTLRMRGVVQNTLFTGNVRGVNLLPNLTISYCDFIENEYAIEKLVPADYENDVSNSTFCNNLTDARVYYEYDVDLSGNCWCDESDPGEGIYDVYDDLSLGLISYLPFSEDCETILSVEEINPVSNIIISPNPIQSECLINWSDIEPTQLMILDITGRLVSTEDLSNNYNEININTNNIPSGIYFIQLISNSRIEVSQKMIISH